MRIQNQISKNDHRLSGATATEWRTRTADVCWRSAGSQPRDVKPWRRRCLYGRHSLYLKITFLTDLGGVTSYQNSPWSSMEQPEQLMA